MLRGQGKFSEAAAEISTALETSSRILLGVDHHETLRRRLTLAEIFRSQGQLEEARSRHEELLKQLNLAAGPEHSLTLLCYSYLAFTLQSMRYFEAVENHLRLVIETQARLLGETHASTLENRSKLATLWRTAGKICRGRSREP